MPKLLHAFSIAVTALISLLSTALIAFTIYLAKMSQNMQVKIDVFALVLAATAVLTIAVAVGTTAISHIKKGRPNFTETIVFEIIATGCLSILFLVGSSMGAQLSYYIGGWTDDKCNVTEIRVEYKPVVRDAAIKMCRMYNATKIVGFITWAISSIYVFALIVQIIAVFLGGNSIKKLTVRDDIYALPPERQPRGRIGRAYRNRFSTYSTNSFVLSADMANVDFSGSTRSLVSSTKTMVATPRSKGATNPAPGTRPRSKSQGQKSPLSVDARAKALTNVPATPSGLGRSSTSAPQQVRRPKGPLVETEEYYEVRMKSGKKVKVRKGPGSLVMPGPSAAAAAAAGGGDTQAAVAVAAAPEASTSSGRPRRESFPALRPKASTSKFADSFTNTASKARARMEAEKSAYV